MTVNIPLNVYRVDRTLTLPLQEVPPIEDFQILIYHALVSYLEDQLAGTYSEPLNLQDLLFTPPSIEVCGCIGTGNSVLGCPCHIKGLIYKYRFKLYNYFKIRQDLSGIPPYVDPKEALTLTQESTMTTQKTCSENYNLPTNYVPSSSYNIWQQPHVVSPAYAVENKPASLEKETALKLWVDVFNKSWKSPEFFHDSLQKAETAVKAFQRTFPQ